MFPPTTFADRAGRTIILRSRPLKLQSNGSATTSVGLLLDGMEQLGAAAGEEHAACSRCVAGRHPVLALLERSRPKLRATLLDRDRHPEPLAVEDELQRAGHRAFAAGRRRHDGGEDDGLAVLRELPVCVSVVEVKPRWMRSVSR